MSKYDETAPRGPKELAYDERIYPLMKEIIELCKEHRINMAAQFMLDPKHDDPDDIVMCTTVLGVDHADEVGMEQVNKVRAAMRQAPAFFALTVVSKP